MSVTYWKLASTSCIASSTVDAVLHVARASEEGNVFYNPKLDVQDACLVEVPTCHMFVLIIGGRFGTKYKQTDESITNHEYKEAVKSGVPIFALVEQQVEMEYLVYRRNKDNPNVGVAKINYPSVDLVRIFDFMEEVQSNSVSNALAPFSDYVELEKRIFGSEAVFFAFEL
jgi:uncharacterized UBP type Zn finger protein